MRELREYGIEPVIADPQADAEEAKRLYGVEFSGLEAVRNMDAVVLAVAHREFADLSMETVDGWFGQGRKVLLDLKGMLDRKAYEKAGYIYFRL